ncbi:hypothetical protein [Lentibacillus sp.]|uniref:hypothetical protein n=1 Tax=Lentibacillus sp. TaxID=1925746 RepID=UPI002B4B4118|nr:hypothetical protein [Lentibacillus sp.]HLS08045.1 hypothetical protein [Lentibacillus sp.]
MELVPIEINRYIKRRAAIMELLDGKLLENTINGGNLLSMDQFHTFHHLRKKAYAYGFIGEDSILEAGK